jgi:DNA repair exonuclease SbcCD ATPase subunit
MARKESIFKVSIDDGNTVNDIKNIDKSMQNLNKTAKETKKTMADSSGTDKFEQDLKEIDALIDSGTLDMRQMTKVVQDYQTIAFRAGANSPVGAKAINKASELKDKINDLNQRVKQGASDYAKMDATIQGATGAMAGFTAFQGVTALMGNENEDLVRSIQKLQGAMAVLNSVQVIRNTLNKDSALVQQFQALQQRIATKQTYSQIVAQKISNGLFRDGSKLAKGFSKALVLTGIGALIAGLTLLVANWDKVKNAILGTSEAQKLNNEISHKAVEAIASELSASDKLAKVLKDETKSREDKVTAVKELQDKYPNLLANVDAEKTSIDDINKALELNVKLLRLKAQQEAINELRTEEFKNQTKALVDAQTDSNQTLLSWSTGLFNAETAEKVKNAQTIESISLSKERVDSLDEMDEALQKEMESLKELGAVDGEETKKSVSNSKSRASQRQKEIDEYNKILTEQFELSEQIRRMKLTANELEEIAISDKYDSLMEKAHGNAELEKQLIEQQTTELNALYQKRADEQSAIDDKQFQDKIKKEDAQFELMQSLTQSKEEKEIADIVAKYEKKFELAEGNIELEAMLQTDLNAKLKEVNDKYRQSEKDADKKLKQEKIANFQEYMSTVSDGLGAISSLNDLVADIQINRAEGDQRKQEKIAERAFNINKAMQLSIATVQGIQAVQNAYTTGLASPITAVNPAYPFIQAGIAGATSAINIGKIASSKYKSSSSPSAPSSSGGGASASSFSIGDNTSSTQTDLNPDGTIQSESSPIKVFVSETDISDVQNGITSIDVKSTF